MTFSKKGTKPTWLSSGKDAVLLKIATLATGYLPHTVLELFTADCLAV